MYLSNVFHIFLAPRPWSHLSHDVFELLALLYSVPGHCRLSYEILSIYIHTSILPLSILLSSTGHRDPYSNDSILLSSYEIQENFSICGLLHTNMIPFGLSFSSYSDRLPDHFQFQRRSRCFGATWDWHRAVVYNFISVICWTSEWQTPIYFLIFLTNLPHFLRHTSRYITLYTEQ